ncbi:MAG: glycine--tRNA ligase [Candidatus Aenigmarchaeota archaeon]|nr:glycine--tRNA ligase [Candidatus Aenigmarchaeota archaeon]
MSNDIVDNIISIAKRRGFFYQSAEIYKPIAGFWDYGPLGVLLKKKIEEEWRRCFIKDEGFFEIEGSNIMPEKVFIASGHVKGFSDPIVQCKKCNSFYRADKLIQEKKGVFVPERTSLEEFDRIIDKENIKCPSCSGELSKTRFFNMMFKLNVGPTEDSEIAYLRPETCQAIFVDFLQVFRAMRAKLPFGIAQIGRSFRNEISPRNALLRQREFTQAELEIFLNPKEKEFPKFEKMKDYKINVLLKGSEKVEALSLEELIENGIVEHELVAYYLGKLQQFLNTLGIPLNSIRFREQEEDEKPFYATYAFDCEIATALGWVEIVANHYRGSYDLSSHSKFSGKDLSIYDEKTKEKLIPHVWEISQGIDRTLFCVMLHAYRIDPQRGWDYFSFSPRIAPYTLGVFPLIARDGLSEKAREVFEMLRKEFDCFYDESGSIGKRYARADEIGVPFCITIDHKTLEDNTVTIRNRDTTEQIRVKISELCDMIRMMK